MPRPVLRTAILSALLLVVLAALAVAASPLHWTRAVPISRVDTSESATIDGPVIATNPNGSAIAVWAWGNIDGTVIQVVSRAPGRTTWSRPVAIGRSTADYAVPVASINARGEAVVTWESSNSTIQAAVRSAAGRWTAPSVLGHSSDISTPTVVIDAKGNATAVWETWDLKHANIRATTRHTGGRWSAPVDLTTPSGDHDGAPQLAVDGRGAVTAIWSRTADEDFPARNGYVIQTADKPAGGEWTAPVDVRDDPFATRLSFPAPP